MEIDYIKIGKRIKKARAKKGYTQEKLAAIVDISQPYLGHIEVGRTKVSLPTLLKIANALDTTVDGLLFDSTAIAIDSYDKDLEILFRIAAMNKKKPFLKSSDSSRRVSLKSNYSRI